ncbi:iron-containing alcohol dehydrogenase [Paenibacillus gansuensis]|uniref:Iron-containing alcohol dehydrogenase n=1 Tax=Paenibacillus gansuensis TaxID=306542 RepID=A0ABW5PDB3_9BACL
MIFRSPKSVYFGNQSLNNLGAILKELGIKKPLIVTDKFLSGSALMDKVKNPLEESKVAYGIFDETMPEPTTKSIDNLREFFAKDNYDGLVAFGGGSAMDSAKALAVMETFGGQYRQWHVPNTPNDDVKYPIIAIPTTAGTGSEVSNACILKEDSGEKLIYLGASCVPAAAIIDYEFTLDMPAKLTAAAGIDALAHALESYISRGANPYSDAMAIHAMKLIGPNLRKVYNNPHDSEAREAVMIGANQAGYAFTSAGLTLVHGMSAPLGGLFHIQHGLSNAMIMPAVHRYSLKHELPRYAEAARIMGLVDAKASDNEAGQALIDELSALNKELNIPTLEEFGVDKEKYFNSLELMAKQALASGAPQLNPIVPNEQELVELYKEIWNERW